VVVWLWAELLLSLVLMGRIVHCHGCLDLLYKSLLMLPLIIEQRHNHRINGLNCKFDINYDCCI